MGPTDPAAFDNPTGAKVYPDLDDAVFESVVDFGCGCGRLARQMIQQEPRPARYVGVDLHPEMIRWCQEQLTPVAPEFTFAHHDVYHEHFNPGEGKPRSRPLPVADESATLILAHSVFTHILADDIEHYIHEFGRILRPGGFARATFFLFDKRGFPMMDPHRNALYTDPVVLSDAVIVDREWLRQCCERAGLKIVGAVAPEIRGYHWVLTLAPAASEVAAIELPPDAAPFGSVGDPTRTDAPPADEPGPADDAAAHATEAARQRRRADELERQLGSTRQELAHTRARLEYVHGLAPIRLARALKRRLP